MSGVGRTLGEIVAEGGTLQGDLRSEHETSEPRHSGSEHKKHHHPERRSSQEKSFEAWKDVKYDDVTPIQELLLNPILFDPVRRPRFPIVLCHGLSLFQGNTN